MRSTSWRPLLRRLQPRLLLRLLPPPQLPPQLPAHLPELPRLLPWLLLLAAGLGLLALLPRLAASFSFLQQPAGFSLGEGWLPFHSEQSYARAFAAGLVNTLRVGLPALGLSVLLGTLLGLGQGARPALLRRLCRLYVEIFRNVPLLLQLLALYMALLLLLPPLEQAGHWGEVWLSKSGLHFPWPEWQDGRWQWARPWRSPFNITGGANLSPEYLTLLGGLVLYTAAYLAEIVRAGVAAVPAGQVQAAAALGLSPWASLRWVVLPQALRLILPPATNQLLGLLKNSSLGIAVGYPELMAVSHTALNQSGKAVECLGLTLLIYLLLSLFAAGVMGGLNRRLNRNRHD